MNRPNPSLPASLTRLSVQALFLALLVSARAERGAAVPWTTYEAEGMKTSGEILEPKYGIGYVEAESSGFKCVQLLKGQSVEFTAQASANALVVRYSLPDSESGGGMDSTLSLYQNDKLVKKIPVTSRFSWLYGWYPFSNDPQKWLPRNFYDEARLKDLSIAKGDVLRIQKDQEEAAYCILDLVDLETVAPPLSPLPGTLSVTDARFGAGGKGETDDTEALKKCIAAAATEKKAVWVPAGIYKITGDIDLPSDVTIQGAGMWHTTFVGDDAQYADAQKRVRFNGRGSHIHLADFAIIGKLNFRNDAEPNDGVGEAFGADSTITRLWIEHTKTGIWVNNSTNLVVSDCRFRNTIADGVNFCVGMRNSTMHNCAARGTGDDCFAIWPATHAEQVYAPGHNLISHCTGQSPFLANGAALYGGEGNRVEDCRFQDIPSGCGVLLSTTFPTANKDKGIDNNFSGTTVVENCEITRAGGFDPWRGWRSALQICLDNRDIPGVQLKDLLIKDSIADGISIVGPGVGKGVRTLSKASMEKVSIPNAGTGTGSRHGLWVRDDACGSLAVSDSKIVDTKNASAQFKLEQK